MTLHTSIDRGTPERESTQMVTLEIDGQSVTVPAGTSIMHAASLAGFQVPKLCATDSLEAFGSCRLCLVEIQGRRGTPASCTTPVEAGMKVSTQTEKIAKLRRGGLVKSVRGPGGGYLLAKGSEATAIADIILAVDEPIDATQCGGRENCREDEKCITHDLWAGLNEHIFSFLRGIRLSQLVADHKRREAQRASGQVVEMHGRPKSAAPLSA